MNYGAAAADVLALMDELDALAEAHARPLAWNAGLDEAGDPAFLAKWSERLNAAGRALNGDAALVQRLREERLTLDLAVLRNYKKLQKAFPSSAEPADAVLARALATARAAHHESGTGGQCVSGCAGAAHDPREPEDQRAAAPP